MEKTKKVFKKEVDVYMMIWKHLQNISLIEKRYAMLCVVGSHFIFFKKYK